MKDQSKRVGSLKEKLKDKTEFKPERFLESLHKLLVEHEADFAIIWLRDGPDLICQGWANGPEGTLINRVVEKWLEKYMDQIMADISEVTHPKEEKKEEKVEEKKEEERA